MVDSSDSDDDFALGLKCARAKALRVGHASFDLKYVDDFDLLFRIITKYPQKEEELTKRQIANFKLRCNRPAEVPVSVQAGSS